MKGKIIQIIPAPSNLFAAYDIDGEEEAEPILCLALTDQGKILIIDTDSLGEIGEPAEEINFLHFKWKQG